jgi:hypothetical protein
VPIQAAVQGYSLSLGGGVAPTHSFYTHADKLFRGEKYTRGELCGGNEGGLVTEPQSFPSPSQMRIMV